MQQDTFRGHVGVFWMVEPDGDQIWLIHPCPSDQVEPYGDCLTCSHGHYELWEDWSRAPGPDGHPTVIGLTPAVRSLLRASEYDEWPRGRVVREPTRSVVYADARLLTAERKAHLLEAFDLDRDTTIFCQDAHYVRI